MEPLVLEQSVTRPDQWRGSFVVRGGELMLFVNEVVLPFGVPLDHYYASWTHGHAGVARMTVRLVEPTGAGVSGIGW